MAEEEEQTHYDQLKGVVEAGVEAGEFGEQEGHILGWVLLVAKSDLQNGNEALVLIHAPYQSDFMTRGILDRAGDYIRSEYSEPTATGEDDDDEGESYANG